MRSWKPSGMPGRSRTSGCEAPNPADLTPSSETIEPAGRIPLAAVLDPRPEDVAAAAPFADAVNIPLNELPDRTHELPPREQTIAVAGSPDLAAKTIRWLQDHGREAAIVRDAPLPAGGRIPTAARLWHPTAFLEETLPHVQPGRALDLACGVGRDAVFAASAGWQVTAVDVLPDAVERGRALEGRYSSQVAPIRWIVADLERASTRLTGIYDLIFGFRYLHRPLFTRLADSLAPGGSLLWETFTTLHRARHGRPSRAERVLEPSELLHVLEGWKTAHYSEAWRGGRHTARVWAIRP